MTDYNPLSADHESVLWTSPDGVTIGASDDHMEVHLPPESADIQTAPVIHLAATEDIENPLWAEGYQKSSGKIYTEVLKVKREELRYGNQRNPIVRCYSILFGDGVEEKHYDDVRGHFRSGNFQLKSR